MGVFARIRAADGNVRKEPLRYLRLFVENQPIPIKSLDHLYQVGKRDRLDQVGVRAEIVGPVDVGGLAGR